MTSAVLPGRAVIERAARVFYNELTSFSKSRGGLGIQRQNPTSLKRLNAAGDRLSRMLLQPIASAGSKRLVIIPDGALQYIPFAALIKPESKQRMAVAHEIVTLPSLSVLSELRDEIANRPVARKTLAVFADPVVEEDDLRFDANKPDLNKPRSRRRAGNARRGFAVIESEREPLAGSRRADEPVNFVRLPFAAEEAKKLAALVADNEREVWTGFDANREKAMKEDLSRFRLIHFATHGLLDFRRPRLSCLLLSRFDRQRQLQDGYLRLQDVYNMKLSADLVVLSACQTALGKEIKGEGLIGLTRGFLYAGAARVAASLWDVDDGASAALMERFYRKMLGPERMSPAAALRAAQIEMMREPRWQDPYFWAAFVLQGEWK